MQLPKQAPYINSLRVVSKQTSAMSRSAVVVSVSALMDNTVCARRCLLRLIAAKYGHVSQLRINLQTFQRLGK